MLRPGSRSGAYEDGVCRACFGRAVLSVLRLSRPVTGEHGAPEERFEDLVDELLGCPGVTPPARGSGFGRSALRWEKKISPCWSAGGWS